MSDEPPKKPLTSSNNFIVQGYQARTLEEPCITLILLQNFYMGSAGVEMCIKYPLSKQLLKIIH